MDRKQLAWLTFPYNHILGSAQWAYDKLYKMKLGRQDDNGFKKVEFTLA